MMETSKHTDRERRRTKLKTRKSWLKSLRNPKTVTSLITVGKLIAHVLWFLVWLYDLVIKVLRE
ncbi:hypothetical protein A6U92_16025 [Agrobacterium rubi]|nr:hypothetical protein A6U92_16025 [Agrobacterium rubi]